MPAAPRKARRSAALAVRPSQSSSTSSRYDQVEHGQISRSLRPSGRAVQQCGPVQAFTRFEDSTDDLLDRIFDVNVKGLLRVSRRHPTPEGAGRRGDRNTATAGIRPRPPGRLQRLKAAVITLTKTMVVGWRRIGFGRRSAR
jgi:hypothetical protein